MWTKVGQWEVWPRLYKYLYWQTRDPQTWRGVVLLIASGTGWSAAQPDQKASIILSVGMFVAGLFNVFASPALRQDRNDEPPCTS